MQSWRLPEIDTPEGSRSPVVLLSENEARAVLIGLDPGQELGDHQVKEHAWIVVVEGSAQIGAGGRDDRRDRRHARPLRARRASLRASPGGAKFLLLLAPWPGPGHFRGEAAAAGP